MQLKSHTGKKKTKNKNKNKKKPNAKQWLLQRAFQAEATVEPTPTCSTKRCVLDYSYDLEILCLCGTLSQLQPQGPLGGTPMSSATPWSHVPGTHL